LEQLEITCSPIQAEHIDDIAIFLSKLIPVNCKLVTEDEPGTRNYSPPSYVTEAIREWRERWEQVNQKLEVLQRAQAGNRKRMMEMEKRILEFQKRLL
jgi:hypothetical protein